MTLRIGGTAPAFHPPTDFSSQDIASRARVQAAEQAWRAAGISETVSDLIPAEIASDLGRIVAESITPSANAARGLATKMAAERTALAGSAFASRRAIFCPHALRDERITAGHYLADELSPEARRAFRKGEVA